MRIKSEDRAKARRAYRDLNDSRMQQKLRADKAWFAGVVYWNPADVSYEELTYELRRIRDLGFNAVRYHTCRPEERAPGVYDFTRGDLWMQAAEDVGINVLLHLGLAKLSDELLAKHGMTREAFEVALPDDERLIAAYREAIPPIIKHYRDHPALMAWMDFGEPGSGARDFMPEVDREGFANWLRDRYGTLETLDTAWNIYPQKDRTIISAFEDADQILKGDKHINYGAMHDFMKYQAEKAIGRAQLVIDIVRELDPEHPISTGSHQLFANQPHLRWDIAQWARIADIHFSSIHLSWHFAPVEGEVDRPVYMQARLTRDYFKDGWTSAYETTGGAVQYSGGYGNAMTPGLMRRLMLSYLAAGHQNVAFWTWNHRPGGWEAGEYGLTTLSGAISDWATEAGKVAKAMDRYHAELWDAEADPHVGLLQNWDTEAILEKEPERHDVKESRFAKFSTGTRMQASRARIGAARAMINHHIPYEYVTEPEILEGIAPVYPVIYAPHMRAVSQELIEALMAYVEAGGQLIADVQFAFMDPWGKLQKTGPDGPHARLFGAYIDTIHDARTAEVALNGLPVDGFYGDLVPTTGKVLAHFDTGKPAITEARIGRGRTLLLAFDPGMLCWRPGNRAYEDLIAELLSLGRRSGWRCDAPMAFRRSTSQADHYFLINDGPPRTSLLEVFDRSYVAGEYVIEGQPLDIEGTLAIRIPARSGVWLRLLKA